MMEVMEGADPNYFDKIILAERCFSPNTPIHEVYLLYREGKVVREVNARYVIFTDYEEEEP